MLEKAKGGYKAVQQNEEAELKLLCICLLPFYWACALLKLGLRMDRLHILKTGIIGKLAGMLSTVPCVISLQGVVLYAMISSFCSSVSARGFLHFNTAIACLQRTQL